MPGLCNYRLKEDIHTSINARQFRTKPEKNIQTRYGTTEKISDQRSLNRKRRNDQTMFFIGNSLRTTTKNYESGLP